MLGIIEGFEGEYVLVEVEGNIIEVKVEEMDPRAKPNDVVEWKDNKWFVNTEETTRRTKKIKELMDDVWQD